MQDRRGADDNAVAGYRAGDEVWCCDAVEDLVALDHSSFSQCSQVSVGAVQPNTEFMLLHIPRSLLPPLNQKLQVSQMAPEVGLEPTALTLTASCSAVELLRILRGTAVISGNRWPRLLFEPVAPITRPDVAFDDAA